MVKAQVIEGVVNDEFHFRYDLAADVLRIALPSLDGRATKGELTSGGDTLLRDLKTDKPLALTANNWWKRCGQGTPPDSVAELEKHVAQLAATITP